MFGLEGSQFTRSLYVVTTIAEPKDRWCVVRKLIFVRKMNFLFVLDVLIGNAFMKYTVI